MDIYDADIQVFNVLIVEDNEDYVKLVSAMLSRVKDTRYVLSVCNDLSSSLDHIRSRTVDLVLLDLNLPDSSGLDTFCTISKFASDFPIIILSASEDYGIAVKAVKAGAQDYLLKRDTNENLLVRSLRYAVERHRMRSRLKNLMLTDELTGINNRRGFLVLASQELKLAKRTGNECIVLFFDLDALKQINDVHGHRYGDEALVGVARILGDTFRDSDVIGRLGGDEFAVLSIGASSENAETILARLGNNIDEYNKKSEWPFRLSVSTGIACFDPNEPATIENLLNEADSSMYRKKKSGKEKIAIGS